MFISTITLFDQYYRHLDAISAQGFNRDLGCEVRERLEQLAYILDRVRELEGVLIEPFARSMAAIKAHNEDIQSRGVPLDSEPFPPSVNITKEEIEIRDKASFEIKLLTETFYYFAGRVRTILRNSLAPIPGLTDFECEGVRNTRNKLLEHAEGKDSQVSIRSFGYGGECGPVIKAARYGGQENVFPDQGLFENAKEFRLNLERLLYAALPKA